MDLEYEWFKRKINEITGVNLDGYKPEQMKRLLGRILDKHGSRNYVEYIKILKDNPENIREFRDKITINVSSLFRDEEKWWELNHLLPDLIRKSMAVSNGKRRISEAEFRTWSVGCSIGAEPVSLAILLEELNISGDLTPFPYEIIATDIDLSILQRAREGVFTEKEIEHVPKAWLKKYFREIPRPNADWAQKSSITKYYAVSADVKKHLDFRFQNLLEENHERDFHLIVCRNVLIYFNRDVIEQLVARFSQALLPDGILFIGATELIFAPGKVGLEPVATGLYRKAC